jgi:hypothetical protein
MAFHDNEFDRLWRMHKGHLYVVGIAYAGALLTKANNPVKLAAAAGVVDVIKHHVINGHPLF